MQIQIDTERAETPSPRNAECPLIGFVPHFRTATALAGKIVALAILVAALRGSDLLAQYTFTTLNDPLAAGVTDPHGISGNEIAGSYSDASHVSHGFLYNTNSGIYSTLNDPLAAAGAYQGTDGLGIAGSEVVGSYIDANGINHGFLYNINTSTYTTIDDPLAGTSSSGETEGTFVSGISGNYLVGYYYDQSSGSGIHGFLYNLTTSAYTTLDYPTGVGATYSFAISGSNVVGCYLDASPTAAFEFNIATNTYTSFQNANGVNGTFAYGISGSDIVGAYTNASYDDNGFLYNGTTWTTIDDPLANLSNGGTDITGISDNTLVGFYYGSNGTEPGFFATAVPEPSTWALLGIFASGLMTFRQWRRTKPNKH